MYVEGFASKLKKARENTGFTQREVSKELGIFQSSLARFETGKGQPNVEVLGMLIDFYGISADWLLGTGSNQTTEPKPKPKKKHPDINLNISQNNNFVSDGNGNMFIELTPEQIKQIAGRM